MPRALFSRDHYAKLVVATLDGFFVNKDARLRVSDRHDILLGESHKVSGSAYRIVKERAYHHGTLLLNSDLSKLEDFLKSPFEGEIVDENGKQAAVSSVRSSVVNLAPFATGLQLDHDLFSRLLINEFISTERGAATICPDIEFATVDEDSISPLEPAEGFHKTFKKLSSEEWNFGATPSFKFRGDLINDGIIKTTL